MQAGRKRSRPDGGALAEPSVRKSRASLLFGRAPPRRGVNWDRIGEAHRAELPRSHVPSVCPPPAAPPKCLCGNEGVWERGRWWCGSQCSDCGFEAIPPAGIPDTPLCDCRHPAVWFRSHWWCVRGQTSGCGFMVREESPHADPEPVDCTAEARASSERTAALLTAAAYGPLGAFTFLGVADCGRGLFARERLPKDAVVGEYGGPRLHISKLVHGEYALQIPGSARIPGPRTAATAPPTPSRLCARPSRLTLTRTRATRGHALLQPATLSTATGRTRRSRTGRATWPSMPITPRGRTRGSSGGASSSRGHTT
jgi:hypothetical protein